MTYSLAPQSVSRFLSSRDWSRSRIVRGRITNNHTQGFTARSVAGETVVEWHEDSRDYGIGRRPARDLLEARIGRLMRTLTDRYKVERRGDTLVVSQKAAALRYKRVKDAFDNTEYMAETETHRFVARRSRVGLGEWVAEIWTLKPVGIIDPIMIADRKLWQLGESLTRAEAYQDIDNYRDIKGI